MSVYVKDITMLASMVGPDQRLKLSELLSFAQEASIAHTTELGMGREMTLDRDLLWVIGRQRFEVARLPQYDEHVTLASWPGMTMRMLFPRFYELKAGEETLIRGVAIWGLIKKKSRKMIFADDYGIKIPAEHQEGELPFPKPLLLPHLRQKTTLKATWANCDLNGHMSNAYYLDFAQSLLPPSFWKSHSVKAVAIDYEKEIRLGEEVEVTYGRKGNAFYVGSDRFAIKMEF